ncbi:MAG: hypothetical protein A2496_19200 [Burkholderiales bacterium RIFOXYC12_FULL_60_6]|nr:MAG: hypothetical protein A2496_19200 [Burkholderiales bacterium RIFOXYC12_FULL_60_6]
MNTPIKIEDLRRMPTFQEMTSDELAYLCRVMVRREYAPGQIIFLEGDRAGGIWFVARGRVRIAKQSLSGRVQGLCLVDPARCFGGCPLFDGAVNPATAQAVDEVVLFILPQSRLETSLENEPELTLALLQMLSQRLSHLAHLSEGLGISTVAQRINDCLMAYMDYAASPPVVALTHEELATLAGTVREVVTRHLAKLERQGVVRLEPGQIFVLDAAVLAAGAFSCPSAIMEAGDAASAPT